MFLFTRTLTLRGNPRETIRWAADMTGYVNQHSDLPVSLWTTTFGAPVGTVVWSTMVESRAVLDTTMSTLMANDAYFDKIEDAEDFVEEPAIDELREIIHNAGPEYRRGAVGSVAMMITAEMAPGQYQQAGAFGIEILELYCGITGAPGLFMKDAYGQFGQVTWLANFADMAEVDAAEAAANKDREYLEKLESSGELFIPGSGRQGLAQRIA